MTTSEVKIFAHVVAKPQRSGKTFYNIRYKVLPPYGDGKTHEQAAHTNNERAAETFRVDFVRELERHFRAGEGGSNIVTIPELFERRLAYMSARIGHGKDEFSPATVTHYALTFKHFREFMLAKKRTLDQPLTSALLEAHKLYRRDLGHAKNTVNMALGALIATANWGAREKIAEPVKVSKFEYRPAAVGLSVQQVGQFFQAILTGVKPKDHKKLHRRNRVPRPGFPTDENGIRQYWRLVFSLFFFTGARRSEIARLTWGMVDFDAGVIRLPYELVKNNEDNVLGLLPEDLAALAGMRPADAGVNDYVFHFEPQHFWVMYRYYLAEGLDITSGPLTRLHSTRHTFATLQLMAGTPLAFVSKMMGHSSEQVTADIYTHSDDKERRAAALRMREFLRMDASMDAA